MSGQLTVNGLIDALRTLVDVGMADGETLIATSKDPEGNGFHMLQGPDHLFSVGKVDEAYGPARAEFEGKPVVVIWSGYPMFEYGEGE